ncbi:MAG: PD-(D/E)XK nuclease family protein [Actinobacteria bacterium]|nr:PD-(D/E)XK nuclease family protein [Actinomycetota bacterium]
MSLPLPSTLSPSKVSSFTNCALAFRFTNIDRLPEPPSLPAVKGTTVHRALELLFDAEPADRTPERARQCLEQALTEMEQDSDYQGLDLSPAEAQRFARDASVMVERYFTLEDPSTVEAVGVEMMLTADLGGVTVRGIIDRLELDSESHLVVTDYKTGRAPSPDQLGSRMGGVHFYSMLCEHVLGRRPVRVQLVYLGGEPQIISTPTSEQSNRGTERRVKAVWSAIERACENEDFRPRPGALCRWCAFQAYCPAFGGDPAQAAVNLAGPT